MLQKPSSVAQSQNCNNSETSVNELVSSYETLHITIDSETKDTPKIESTTQVSSALVKYEGKRKNKNVVANEEQKSGEQSSIIFHIPPSPTCTPNFIKPSRHTPYPLVRWKPTIIPLPPYKIEKRLMEEPNSRFTIKPPHRRLIKKSESPENISNLIILNQLIPRIEPLSLNEKLYLQSKAQNEKEKNAALNVKGGFLNESNQNGSNFKISER